MKYKIKRVDGVRQRLTGGECKAEKIYTIRHRVLWLFWLPVYAGYKEVAFSTKKEAQEFLSVLEWSLGAGEDV